MRNALTGILVFEIFFSTKLFSQNYRTIVPGVTSHFSYTKINSPGKTFFNTISIDSIVNVPAGDELYNFVSLENDSFTSCLYSNRHTWIASNIFQDASGAEYFLNSSNDTIFIYPQTALNNFWHLYNYTSGNYIEARVSNISTQTFLGITDNVKTILLQAKNSGGINIPNIMNGKEIKISGNHGFVQTLGFKIFPADTTAFLLSGLSNPQAGILNLTADSIFNFNVGDELHYHNEWQFQLQVQDIYYVIAKFLTKSISPNSDTLTYTMDYCWRHENYNNTIFTVSTFHDTIPATFIIPEWSFLDKFTFQHKDTSASGFLNSYDNGYLNFYTDTNYLSRLKKETYYYYYFDIFQQCFTEVIGFGVFPDIVYAPGLGKVYRTDHTCWGFSFQCFDSLVYYKKGNEVWGTPLSCPALLSADENSGLSSQIKIFPNPTDGNKITVTGIFLSPVTELTDAFGRIVKADINFSESKIELNLIEPKAGIYFLKIKDGEKTFTSKIVLI